MNEEQQAMMDRHHAHTAVWVTRQYAALNAAATAQGFVLDARGAILAAAQLYAVAAEQDRRAADAVNV